MKAADLVGQSFGWLKVIRRAGSQNNSARWECRCKCGKTVFAKTGDLKNGKTKSCGCWRKTCSKKKRIEEVGNVYGYLTVLYFVGTDKEGKALYLCKCKCGNTIITTGKRLRTGITTSCGCYNKEATSKRSLKNLVGQKFGMLTVVSRAENKYSKAGNLSTQWNCICDCGNSCTVAANALTTKNHSRSCGCMKMSFREKEISDLLSDLKISFVFNYSFNDLFNPSTGHLLKYDFALLDSNRNVIGLIEHQGEQHYFKYANGFGDLQREVTDDLKRAYCRRHSIPLFEISFSDNIHDSVINALNTVYHTSYDNTVPRLKNE